MKKPLNTRGYLRTILLSVLAAFAIECCVNADEVKDAFIAGRNLQRATTATIRTSTDEWFKVPQHVSRVIGWLVAELND